MDKQKDDTTAPRSPYAYGVRPLKVYKPFVGGLGKAFEYAPETTPEDLAAVGADKRAEAYADLVARVKAAEVQYNIWTGRRGWMRRSCSTAPVSPEAN